MNISRGKIVGGAFVILALGGIGATGILALLAHNASTSESTFASPSALSALPLDPAQLALAAFNACDSKAADAEDASRRAAPVPVEQFAPGEAIQACREAVRLNPGNSTSLFELGRSLWIARQDREAFEYLKKSAELGYPIAEKYLGDAFYQQRVPEGVTASAEAAADWYDKADQAGVVSAHEALKVAQQEMRRHEFVIGRDAAEFQAPDYIQILWTGDLKDSQSPVGLAYYVQGLVGELNGTDSKYMDLTCKPAIDAFGSVLLDYGQIAAMINILNSKSENMQSQIKRGVGDWIAGDRWAAKGANDAHVLFNKDIYGCDSPVVKQILNNIVLKLRIGDSNTITVLNTPQAKLDAQIAECKKGYMQQNWRIVALASM